MYFLIWFTKVRLDNFFNNNRFIILYVSPLYKMVDQFRIENGFDFAFKKKVY